MDTRDASATKKHADCALVHCAQKSAVSKKYAQPESIFLLVNNLKVFFSNGQQPESIFYWSTT